jgi:hypothetical protein
MVTYGRAKTVKSSVCSSLEKWLLKTGTPVERKQTPEEQGLYFCNHPRKALAEYEELHSLDEAVSTRSGKAVMIGLTVLLPSPTRVPASNASTALLPRWVPLPVRLYSV